MKLQINGSEHDIPVHWQDASLLLVLRELLGYTGSKFGCGRGFCGACTVHIDGEASRSCVLSVTSVPGKSITTIEGLASNDNLHPVQQAWVEESVPQCGYCQSGQMMTAAALLQKNTNPDADEIAAAMEGNLCRCGTYGRIRRGVARAAQLLNEQPISDTRSDGLRSEKESS
jgi:isoquinoline 1-oxidoreductase alpha subunit